MNRRENELVAKVAAINLANKVANELQPLLKIAFGEFVGKKIEKTSGGLLAKVEEVAVREIVKFKNQATIYKIDSKYSLVYAAKTCVSLPNGDGCVYHEAVFYVGEMNVGDLTKVNNEYLRQRTDYTVAEILAKRKAVEQAKSLLSNAQSELYPFSE